MLTISKATHAAFEQEAQAKWLDQAVRAAHARHLDWCRGRQPEEIRDVCRKLDELSRKCDFSLQASFEILLDLVVVHGFDFRFTPFQTYLLERPCFSEPATVAAFCADVMRGSRVQLLTADQLALQLQQGVR
jgi:hypothetical protein